MIAPLSLSNLLTVSLALLCLWTSGSQSSSGVMKLWRLAVPPCLATAVALVLLASVFDPTIVHDAEWVLAAAVGAVIGRTRGWLMRVESDQKWGLVKLPRAYDGLVAAFALLVLSMIDFAGAIFESAVIEPPHVAAGAAFCAGYLVFRAIAITMRAIRTTHAELSDAKSVR